MGKPRIRKLGHVIAPSSYQYDLEASLRAHRMLVARAILPQWRFKNEWVVTGPYETLMGFPYCGSTYGDTREFCLRVYAHLSGFMDMTKLVNKHILDAMCCYPEFASLDETLPPHSFSHCSNAVDSLARFNGGDTLNPLNSCHNRARKVGNVRIECRDSGVYVSADVTYGYSTWSLFSLARIQKPKWNERVHLSTFLHNAEQQLILLAHRNKRIDILKEVDL